MIVFVDENQCIKAVGSSDDPNLTALTINDDEESNPFLTWSTAKICCYKCTVDNGVVTMMTPYRDSRTLDYIDEIGHELDGAQDKAHAFDILIGEVEE